ncbi:hypothetical protein [Leucobacter sp. 1207-22]|uniref:hypothetical protein n=1 Tax=Leucobacter sp. 1207-22 TaxID=2604456 RepID=UPI004062CBED
MKGHLWVSEGGLWFDPLRSVEHTANPASVEWGEIIQVHSVPGNRNIGSIKMSGISRRSFGPRLLVTASSGKQLFEIKQRAAAAAARLIQEEMKART